MLERAIAIAVEAHEGQIDKAGAPYVLHPLRMMFKMSTDIEKQVAVLHDVAEDGPGWSLARLEKEGFSKEVLDALDCVTARKNETYDAFIDRVMLNPIANTVKRADLEDNMNILRISEPSDKDWARFRKYHHSWNRLMKAR